MVYKTFDHYLGDVLYLISCEKETATCKLYDPELEVIAIHHMRISYDKIVYYASEYQSSLICRENEVDTYEPVSNSCNCTYVFSTYKKAQEFCNKVKAGEVVEVR